MLHMMGPAVPTPPPFNNTHPLPASPSFNRWCQTRGLLDTNRRVHSPSSRSQSGSDSGKLSSLLDCCLNCCSARHFVDCAQLHVLLRELHETGVGVSLFLNLWGRPPMHTFGLLFQTRAAAASSNLPFVITRGFERCSKGGGVASIIRLFEKLQKMVELTF